MCTNVSGTNEMLTDLKGPADCRRGFTKMQEMPFAKMSFSTILDKKYVNILISLMSILFNILVREKCFESFDL